MKDTFGLCIVCWLIVAAFFVHQFFKRRPGGKRGKHPLSLFLAVCALGWASYSAREGHYLPLGWSAIPTSAALILGVSGAVLCTLTWVGEWAQKRP